MTDRWTQPSRGLSSGRRTSANPRRAVQNIRSEWAAIAPRVPGRTASKLSPGPLVEDPGVRKGSGRSAPHLHHQGARPAWGRVPRSSSSRGGNGRTAIEKIAGADYFRYVDTRMRRIESALQGADRARLVGPRRQLKDVLDAVGQISTIYPYIADDGGGGVFAEWKAGPERVEIAVDLDGDGYVSHSFDGSIAYYVDFVVGESLPLAVLSHIRRILDHHSASVNAVNPNWRSLFLG